MQAEPKRVKWECGRPDWYWTERPEAPASWLPVIFTLLVWIISTRNGRVSHLEVYQRFGYILHLKGKLCSCLSLTDISTNHYPDNSGLGECGGGGGPALGFHFLVGSVTLSKTSPLPAPVSSSMKRACRHPCPSQMGGHTVSSSMNCLLKAGYFVVLP